jgi:hypothetical protein
MPDKIHITITAEIEFDPVDCASFARGRMEDAPLLAGLLAENDPLGFLCTTWQIPGCKTNFTVKVKQ